MSGRGRPLVARAARVVAGLALLGGLSSGAARIAAEVCPLPAGFFVAPSTTVRYAGGAPAHVFLSPDDKVRVAVEDLGDVDPRYVEALLAFEDARFFEHPGVDPLAVARAALGNLGAGRVVSGASTLTMQLVRMREPRPRTLSSKIVEAFRALQVEARLDKQAILRAYLTHLPFGGNLEGVEAASRAFFGHGPEALDPWEIATLLAIPQRPTPRAPSPANAARLTQARAHVLATLQGAGLFEEPPPPPPVPTRVRPVPREIPHLAYRLRAERPRQSSLRTTLRRQTQRAAEQVFAAARAGLRERGIRHGAGVVLDHRAGEVVALVGNLDFWSDDAGSQIPAFDVPRSVGSTLKPFIYGRAIEAGTILPDTLVADVPRVFPGYRPENFDGRFRGAVRAREALGASLNLPFVDLLETIGPDVFVGWLSSLGAHSVIDTPGHYGLSAALGTIELSPLELAGLYTGIARDDGRAFRPRLLTDAPAAPPLAALAPGVAQLVRDALDDRDRPDFPARGRFRGVPAGVHWKTGTSFGHRDAWAVGSDEVHTAVVWLGNLDRAPSPALVGARAAGPLFFDLLEALPGAAPRRPAPPSPDLVPIEVCALSGRPAGPACPHRERALALAHQTPTRGCELHVHRHVSARTGLELPPGCLVSELRRKEAFEVWPPEVVRHLGQRSRRLPAPPALDPRCASAERGPAPRIRSPAHATRLLVPGLDPREQEVPLEADGEGALRWFVNGRYLGEARPGERLWWIPEPGEHELVVMDGAGRAQAQRLRVALR